MQDVLSKAVGGSTMTVAEATNIADNALEHTVRTILAALQAPEILKSTSGLPHFALPVCFILHCIFALFTHHRGTSSASSLQSAQHFGCFASP